MINFFCSLPFFFVFLSVFMLKHGSIETSKPWIYWSFGFVLLASIVSYFVNRKSMRINLSDGLFLIFYFIALSTSYIAPFTNDTKLEYLTLLIILYFCFRITLIQNDAYKYWFSLFYVLTVCCFSIYGSLQYYHVIPFRSPVAVMSGSFSNHGLYAGFLAIALPLIFHILLRYKSILNKRKGFKCVFYYRILWILSAFTFFITLFNLSHLPNRAVILSLIGGFTLVIIGTYKKSFPYL